MPLRRRAACRLLVVGALLAGMPGGAMAQSGSLSDRAAFLEQRLTTLKSEIGKIKDSLRDAKTILEYFELISKNMVEFSNNIKIYDGNCAERKREYNKMLQEKSPFAARLSPAVQRCEADRPGFDEALRSLFAKVEKISSDVNEIKKERDRLGNESNRVINEQNTFQAELNLRRNTRDISDQIQTFQNNRF